VLRGGRSQRRRDRRTACGPTTTAGELAQILPTPRHFEQASTLVTRDQVAEAVPCGPDIKRYVDTISEHVDAGYDEIYIGQIRPEPGRVLRVLV